MWTVIVGDTNLIAVSQRFVDCPASFGYIGWRWCTKRVRDTLPCIRLFWRFCRWTCWAPTDRFVLRTLISYLLLLSSHRAILVSALINKLSNTYRRLLFCVRCVVWFDILPISSYSDTCIFISYILWTFCGTVAFSHLPCTVRNLTCCPGEHWFFLSTCVVRASFHEILSLSKFWVNWFPVIRSGEQRMLFTGRPS